MIRFRDNWKAAEKWRWLADELNKIGRLLNNLRGHGIDILPNASGGLDFAAKNADLRPQIVFVAGHGLQIPSGAKYIAVYFDGRMSEIGEATYGEGLMDGFPDDCEYYDLSRTFGDIHVPRA